MALRQIRVDGDDILRKKCKEVKEMNERTETLIDDMLETMYDAAGVGLAAPQVGVLKRIVVIDVDYENPYDNPYVMINPVILESDGEQCGDEGCLSIPGKVAEVTRPNRVVVKFLDRDMKEVTLEATELFARAVCHELDHLDGVLYKDVAEGPLRDVEAEEAMYEEEDEF